MNDPRPALPPDLAGALANPQLVALFQEALALLGEGVPAATIESLSRDSEMPMTPLRALDELSLAPFDVALHNVAASHDHSEAAGQGHSHAHDHGHDAAHDHGHDHGHDHDHDHDHGHGHGHDHPTHDHAHCDHDHGHHGHTHHDHGHDHGQHAHHDHDHGHEHQHDHDKVHGSVHPALGHLPESAVYVLEKMSHGFDRLGRATGGGFYDYDDEPQLWSGLKVFERRRHGLSDEDIRDRLRYTQIRAALSATADEPGSGWGFADDGGQVSAFVARTGDAAVRERLAQLADRFGKRFVPAPPHKD